MATPKISTGFTALDDITSGLQRGDLILLASRPSNGKTALALNMARYIATEGQQPVAVFSLEMSKERLVEALNMSDCPIHRSDGPNQSVAEMRSFARLLEEKQGTLGLIVVDYLQLVQASQPSENRAEELSVISQELKCLAQEFNCPVIALSQVPEVMEQREDKRPLLSDFGQVSFVNEADLVAFTHRPSLYENGSTSTEMMDVIIGKQRDGLPGTVQLGFQPEYARFTNLA